MAGHKKAAACAQLLRCVLREVPGKKAITEREVADAVMKVAEIEAASQRSVGVARYSQGMMTPGKISNPTAQQASCMIDPELYGEYTRTKRFVDTLKRELKEYERLSAQGFALLGELKCENQRLYPIIATHFRDNISLKHLAATHSCNCETLQQQVRHLIEPHEDYVALHVNHDAFPLIWDWYIGRR